MLVVILYVAQIEYVHVTAEMRAKIMNHKHSVYTYKPSLYTITAIVDTIAYRHQNLRQLPTVPSYTKGQMRLV